MSRLSRAITAKQTGVVIPGDRKARLLVDFDITAVGGGGSSLPLGYEYVVSASFGARTQVSAACAKRARLSLDAQAKRQVRGILLEEVFGEFRRELYELRNDVLSGNSEDAADRIDAIIKQMYED